jgi:hypothetical protein
MLSPKNDLSTAFPDDLPTAIVKFLVAVCPLESWTVVAKLYTPVVVGVPEMLPTAESDNPGGSDPELRLQVYGAAPPETTRDSR